MYDKNNLDDLIEKMEEKMKHFDLSDTYLLDHNKDNRYQVGIGEYVYGITMVPCEWVLPYLKELQEIKKEK